MSCGNNMKQIGLASLNHESTYQRLPPSLFVDIGLPPGAPGQPGFPYPAIVHCWSVFLLPYMEQNQIYSLYDQKFPWFSSPTLVPGTPNNQAALRNVIPGFICPSSPGGAQRRITGSFRFGATFPYQDLAATDYATCSSINQGSITFFGYAAGTTQNDLFSSLGPEFKGAGAVVPVLGADRRRANTISFVTDGTSNTILMCEDAGRPDFYIGNKIDTTRKLNDGGWGHHENDYGLDGAISGGRTSPGNCVINCHNDNETYSFHTGGATHGFTDGSVRFLSQSISPQTYAALITASGAGRTPAEVSPSTNE